MQTNQTLASAIQNCQRLLSQNQTNQRLHRASISAICQNLLPVGELKPLLQNIVETFEIFRTAHHQDSHGVMWQEVMGQAAIQCHELDWQTLDEREIRANKNQVARRIDTIQNNQPWIDLTVARLPGQVSWINLSMPGLNTDLFSLAKLMGMIVNVESLGKGSHSLTKQSEEIVQYSDLVPWLNDFLLDEDLEDARNYWDNKDTAKAFSEQFGLARYLRKPGKVNQVCRIALGDHIVELNNFAGGLNATLGDLICASLRLATNKMAGQIHITRILDSRADESLSDAMGPLSRALPIFPKRGGTLTEAVSAERNAMAEAQDYVECFFRPSQNETQSFPFTFESVVGIDQEGNNGYIDRIECTVESARIQFSLIDQGQYTALIVHFDEQYIDRVAIEDFLSNWKTELIQYFSQDKKVIRSFQPFKGDERAHHKATKNVVDWFNKNNCAGTGKIISPGGNTTSMNEVNLYAKRIANLMLERGIGKGDQVALNLPHSVEFVIAMLAVLKSGAAYIPIDVDLPEARISSMLAESDAKLIISGENNGNFAIEQLVFSGLSLAGHLMDELDQSEPVVDIGSNDLAYVLYTSGSTGKAKGVGISHRALLNHMAWINDEFAFSDETVFLQRTSVSFDASVWEYWSPMLAGATMVIAPKEANYNLSLMQQLIVGHQVSVLQMVPAQLDVLLAQNDVTDITSLQYLFCGGEALKTSLANNALQTFKCEVINVYGPSECCIQSIFWRFDPHLYTDLVPIGKPIDNVQYVVIKNTGEQALRGEEGELWLSGQCLFSGYQKQPDLTDNACFEDKNNGVTYYKTGDYVRVLHDDNLYFLERLDNQVKINGFRIELEEISSLVENSGLASKAVCVCDKTSTNLSLFAKSSASEIQIEQLLQTNLPAYMVPAQIILTNQFPQLSNGKLDINAMVLQAEGLREVAYQAPTGNLEIGLAQIWQTALSSDKPIGVNSDFFLIGGHSLLAMKVVTRISDELNVNINVRDLFEHNTISALASHIEKLKATGEAQDLEPVPGIQAVGLQDDEEIEEVEL